ncbi:hypothetical protein [Oceanicella sp. SM1341]|uniref:hypothetical protein n=1 Tax=Oceanicella sp. SM1341 TaxID=1548889 RepID=UPI000E523E99|nr:hypothetical protein [Oceanicella sp. SM1341]
MAAVSGCVMSDRLAPPQAAAEMPLTCPAAFAPDSRRYSWSLVMSVVAFAFRLIVGIVFGILSAVMLSPAAAALAGNARQTTAIALVASVFACGLLCVAAPTARRALGRGFLVLGACTFALPLSAFLLSGRAVTEIVANSEPGTEIWAAVGAGAGGALVTGMATFMGFIVGTLLLLVGLVLALGGRREVIIIERVSSDRGQIR